jgi:phosphate/sulfate permease
MASSVGAKSLTLRQAVLVSAIFEFCGAFFLGSQVTATIRKGKHICMFCTRFHVGNITTEGDRYISSIQGAVVWL